jgi:hypothetical protein
LKGSTLRSRDAKYQQNLLEKFEELALPLLKEKKMKIEVHEVRSSLYCIEHGWQKGLMARCSRGQRSKMRIMRCRPTRIAAR